MKILDYATNRTLNDVGIVLTRQEAEELMMYLQKLTARPDVDRIYLSEFDGCLLERELTVALEKPVAHVA